MRFINRFADVYRQLLPSPFTIAVALTVVTFVLALLLARPEHVTVSHYAGELLVFWEQGLWNSGLLVFAFQMMLMLVLGHTLALSSPVDRIIRAALRYTNTTAKAAAWVTLLTMLVGLFNWGLALVFGAIFARKVAEQASQRGWALNYPLIGAAGYSGLLVWHGGFSGSSLIKVAETGHLASLVEGTLDPTLLTEVPESVSFYETVFSPMNLTASLVVLIVLPVFMFAVGKRVPASKLALRSRARQHNVQTPTGAERLDHSTYLGWGLALFLSITVFIKVRLSGDLGHFFTPNHINLVLLALCLWAHGNISRFLGAVDEAIGGAAGILIQFPFYFGIMGMMSTSGMLTQVTDWIASISTEATYPLFTFVSAAVVNVFVPSGGGQWAIQGPIIVQTCLEMNIPLARGILAMAYGDQLTNMLQPFWALPLLGITSLKAKEILPYTLLLMVVAGLIYTLVLVLF